MRKSFPAVLRLPGIGTTIAAFRNPSVYVDDTSNQRLFEKAHYADDIISLNCDQVINVTKNVFSSHFLRILVLN